MAAERDASSFTAAFTEWVEACWFGERDAADRRLDAVLAFPPEVVLVGSLSLLGRLMQTFAPGGAEVAGALAHHLIVTGPDPSREQLIGDVVLAAGSTPAARASVLARHGSEAVTRAALECASFLAQAVANRDGVVPSTVLGEV